MTIMRERGVKREVLGGTRREGVGVFIKGVGVEGGQLRAVMNVFKWDENLRDESL